jgi:hypothetical protein
MRGEKLASGALRSTRRGQTESYWRLLDLMEWFKSWQWLASRPYLQTPVKTFCASKYRTASMIHFGLAVKNPRLVFLVGVLNIVRA